MPSEHPFFEPWEADAAHPFPVGNLDFVYANQGAASIGADFTIPQALPAKTTYAERSIGIKDSCKLWFAIECTEDAQGRISCEVVLRADHRYWYKEHGETAGGPTLEVRLHGADLTGSGWREHMLDHGPHCDVLQVSWSQVKGKLKCYSNIGHVGMSVRELLDFREEMKTKKSPYKIIEQLDKSYEPFPSPAPAPNKPKPKPRPDKDAN